MTEPQLRPRLLKESDGQDKQAWLSSWVGSPTRGETGRGRIPPSCCRRTIEAIRRLWSQPAAGACAPRLLHPAAGRV